MCNILIIQGGPPTTVSIDCRKTRTRKKSENLVQGDQKRRIKIKLKKPSKVYFYDFILFR